MEQYYPTNLTDDFSPSIPLDFPKKEIPKDICTNELLKCSLCILKLGNENACDK